VIGCLVFANFMLRDIHKNADTAPVMAELAAIRTEGRQNDSITRAQIAAVAEHVNDVDVKVSKVILIVAANSNSDLIRRLVPYLENVATRQDIYSFVLDIQRDQQRRDTTHRISVERKNHSAALKKASDDASRKATVEMKNRFPTAFKKADNDFDSIYLKK
jgi:hypothetical protein